ncbi:hypothetical protein BH10BAC1_BH10BAC1_02710 [soil metagenome]
MKLFKLLGYLLLTSTSVFAKDSTWLNRSRFTIGIHASPDYCFRELGIVRGTDYALDTYEYRTRTEIPAIGFTTGAVISYTLKKQVAISLGVNYSQKCYTTEPLTLVTAQNPYEPIGTIQFRHNFDYLEIPVKATAILGKKKIRFVASAGISPSFLLYEREIYKIKYNTGTRVNTKQQPNYINKTFNLFVNGSLGADIKMGKRMGLRLEPYYSYGLNQTVGESITEYLWCTGLNVGCYIFL